MSVRSGMLTRSLSILKRLGKTLPPESRARVRSSPPVRMLLEMLEPGGLPQEITVASGVDWRRLPDCQVPLLDAGGAQIGSRVYVICGLTSPSEVSTSIRVFDMSTERWVAQHEIPDDLAHSHHGVATDTQRYIYIAAGQHGGNCRPAVATTHCFDTVSGAWSHLPPLPAPRYAGALRLWRGRLHFIGGADEDRWTPTSDHWSLAVDGARALETEWRTERPFPVPGMHRASCVVADRLYLFGGQQGDFMPIPGDSECTCTGQTQETYLASAYRLSEPSGPWERLADLPIAGSHWDFSSVVMSDRVLLVGGQVYKDPEDFHLKLTNAIQAYDTRTDRWSIAGHTPYAVKTPVTGHLDGSIFFTAGQSGRPVDFGPSKLVSHSWRAKMPAAETSVHKAPLPSLKGRRVLLVAHRLDRTGSPLELLELAQAMIASGAEVRLADMKERAEGRDVAAAHGVPLVPYETAVELARSSDLIVANSMAPETKKWVGACLEIAPELASKLLWLVHEIDVKQYAEGVELLNAAAASVFDSQASLDAWAQTGASPHGARVIHPGISDALLEASQAGAHLFPEAGRWAPGRGGKLLSRARIRHLLGVRPDDVLVLSVASYSEHKGQDLLLRTVSELASSADLPLKLCLVGFTDELAKNAFVKARSRGERRVIGPKTAIVKTPHLAAFYHAADMHVLNSQGADGRGETFGRVHLEAMAFGLPVLGTRAGGVTEIIQEGVEGFLYPIGEQGQTVLARRLEELATSGDRRREMGGAGRKRVAQAFHKSRYLDDMNEVLARVIDGGKT